MKKDEEEKKLTSGQREKLEKSPRVPVKQKIQLYERLADGQSTVNMKLQKSKSRSRSPCFQPQLTLKRPITPSQPTLSQTQHLYPNLDELTKIAKRHQKLQELRDKHKVKKFENLVKSSIENRNKKIDEIKHPDIMFDIDSSS